MDTADTRPVSSYSGWVPADRRDRPASSGGGLLCEVDAATARASPSRESSTSQNVVSIEGLWRR